MKRFFCLLVLAALILGLGSLMGGPLTGAAAGPKCKGNHVCPLEPGDPPVCPPCEYWEPCGPKCGCRPIPGCKL